CGYHPASVAARDAPTAAPSESASPSISAKLSALPTPRPPDTTMAASVSSGRSLRSWVTRSVMCAPLAVSVNSTVTGSSAAAPGDTSGATAFGRTATIGMPAVTFDLTMMAPPKMDCSATGPPSPGVRSTASVSTPEPVLTASRPATSLPSAVAGTSPGGGGRRGAQRGGSRGGRRGHVARHALAVGGVALGGAVRGEPLPARLRAGPQPDRGRLAEPARQREQFERDLLDRLTVVRGEDEDLRHATARPFRSDELLRGEELGRLDAAVALILDDRACRTGRPLAETDHLGRGGSEPHLGGVDPGVGDAQHFDRLLLRRHDPLERRVPWLVDLLDHADHGGQRSRHLVVAVVCLPVDGDGRPVDLHLAGQGELGDAEALGQHRGDHAHPGVGRLRA